MEQSSFIVVLFSFYVLDHAVIMSVLYLRIFRLLLYLHPHHIVSIYLLVNLLKDDNSINIQLLRHDKCEVLTSSRSLVGC